MEIKSIEDLNLVKNNPEFYFHCTQTEQQSIELLSTGFDIFSYIKEITENIVNAYINSTDNKFTLKNLTLVLNKYPHLYKKVFSLCPKDEIYELFLVIQNPDEEMYLCVIDKHNNYYDSYKKYDIFWNLVKNQSDKIKILFFNKNDWRTKNEILLNWKFENYNFITEEILISLISQKNVSIFLPMIFSKKMTEHISIDKFLLELKDKKSSDRDYYPYVNINTILNGIETLTKKSCIDLIKYCNSYDECFSIINKYNKLDDEIIQTFVDKFGGPKRFHKLKCEFIKCQFKSNGKLSQNCVFLTRTINSYDKKYTEQVWIEMINAYGGHILMYIPKTHQTLKICKHAISKCFLAKMFVKISLESVCPEKMNKIEEIDEMNEIEEMNEIQNLLHEE